MSIEHSGHPNSENEPVFVSSVDVDKLTDRQVNLTLREIRGGNKVRYGVEADDGTEIGYVSLLYYITKAGQGQMVVDVVNIKNVDYLGQGYGEAIYKKIALQPHPNSLPDIPYTFKSSDVLNDNSTQLWERLVNKGLAHKVDDHYEYVGPADNEVSLSSAA